ncbi:hypothetical protein UlMin_009974 [Ulmus minor]
MVRAPCCEKMGLKRGPWTPEEDQILVSFIQKNGHGNWRALPKQAGLLRCGKSCRLRWINYLRPDIKRGNFTREEEETIIKLHETLGNRWSAIAATLPGRTDNEIKNVWHTHIKKKLPKSETKNFSPIITLPSTCNTTVTDQSESATLNAPERSTPTSPQPSSSDFSSVTDTSLSTEETNDNENIVVIKTEEMEIFPEIDESLWSEELPEASIESQFDFPSFSLSDSVEMSYRFDSSLDDKDFWFDVFVKAGGSPELPEI